MNKGVIFDLDQTLIDSSCFEKLRQVRDWKSINAQIHNAREFPHVSDIIRVLNENGIKVSIVTSAPKSYCKSIIKYFDWEIDFIVGYHDVAPHIKPNPRGYEMVLENLSLNIHETIVVGDRNIDIHAANSIGLKSIFCTYGNTDKNYFESSTTYIANSTDDVFNTLKEFFILIY
jgi:phosphoglycolate phosphatase